MEIKSFFALLLIITIISTGLMIADLAGYESYNIDQHASGIMIGETMYIVYHDYKNLYSSIGLIEWNTTTDKISTNILLEEGSDFIFPEIYETDDGILIAWIELVEGYNNFGFGIYDPDTKSIENVNTIPELVPGLDVCYSYDGTNFTLASLHDNIFQIRKINRLSKEIINVPLQISGKITGFDVRGSNVYYGLENNDMTEIYIYDGVKNTLFHTIQGYLFDLKGCNRNITWLEKKSESGGEVMAFCDGNNTFYDPVKSFANSVEILEINDRPIISWTEYETHPDNNFDVFKIRVAEIKDTNEQDDGNATGIYHVGDIARDTSEGVRRYPTLHFMVEDNDAAWICWIDRGKGQSLRTEKVQSQFLGKEIILIENGEIPSSAFVLPLTALTMIPLIGFIFIIGHENKNDNDKFDGNKMQINYLKSYNVIEAYYFLKYIFITILIFIVLIDFRFLSPFYLTRYSYELGNSLGARIGYYSIAHNFISICITIPILVSLFSEIRVSKYHKRGYILLFISFIIALGGLIFYLVSKIEYNNLTIYIVGSTGLISISMAMISIMIFMTALTTKKAFLINAIPFIIILITVFTDMLKYHSSSFFPTIILPGEMMPNISTFTYTCTPWLTFFIYGIVLLSIFNKKDVNILKERIKYNP